VQLDRSHENYYKVAAILYRQHLEVSSQLLHLFGG